MKRFLSISVFLFSQLLSAHSISVGDEVAMVAKQVKVRSCAGTSCSLVGKVSIDAVGEVIDGPKDKNGYYWWKIDWDGSNPDGWTPTPKNGYSWYYEKPDGLRPGGSSSSPEVVDSNKPTLHWNKINGVHHYLISLLEKTNDGTEIIGYYDNISADKTSFQLPDALQDGKRYLWSVIPYDDDDDMGLKAEYIYFDVKEQAQGSYDLTIRPDDITVRSASGDDSEINEGEMFDIRVNIRNVGDIDSGSHRVKYGYKSVEDNTFTYFDTDSDSGVDSGGSHRKTSNDENIKGGSGTHYVRVCVYNNDDDSDHNNDCGLKSFEVKSGNGGGDSGNTPQLDDIDPQVLNSSWQTRTVTLTGDDMDGTQLQESIDNNSWHDASNRIASRTNTTIIIKRDFWTVNKTPAKYSYRLVKDGSSSEVQTITVNYRPLPPYLQISSSHSNVIKSGQSLTLEAFALDLEDMKDEIKNYTLWIKWEDGKGYTQLTKEYLKTVSVNHTFPNLQYTKNYTVSIYAEDSDGQSSRKQSIKVTVEGSGESGASDKKVFSAKKTEKLANDPCSASRNAYNTHAIDKATGAENFSITPLTVKGVFDLPFTLKYNSLLLYGQDMGKGWSHNYHVSASVEMLEEVDTGKIRVHWDNSDKKYNDFTFDHKSGNDYYYRSIQKATKDDLLIRHDDGSWSELKRKNGMTYYFDNKGFLNSIINKQNQKVNVSFNNRGQITQVTEEVSGVYLQYEYDNNGKLIRVEDNAGRMVHLDYTSAGLLKEVTFPDNTIRRFHYNVYDQIDTYEIVDTEGEAHRQFYLKYLDTAKVASEYDGNNIKVDFTYDTTKESGRIHSLYVDKAGEATRTLYDDTNFNPYQITYPDGTKEELEYYPNGKLKTKTDRANHKTDYFYDDKGNLEKVHYDDGSEEQYTYDDNRNVLSKKIIDKNKKEFITHNTYVGNNLVDTELPNKEHITYTYDPDVSYSQMLTKTVGDKTTKYFYYEDNDASEGHLKGLLQKIETQLGLTTEYTYDQAGRLITETNQYGGVTTYTYDAMNRVKSIKNPAGKLHTFKYDFMGHKIEEKDFNGNITKYEYDANGNMIKTIDAEGNEYRFEYDSADRLKKSFDPLNHFVEYEYDSMGRVSKITDKRGNATTYEYDAMGNLKSQYDAYGNKLFTNTYNSKNQLIESVDSLNQKTATEYTVFGKPSQVTDPLDRVTKFEYDAVGRLIKAINAQNKEASQVYNPTGTLKEFTDAGGSKTEFTYDDDGKLQTTTTATGSTSTNTYDDKTGLLKSFKNGRHDVTTFQYDNLGRVREAKDKDGTITYTYDNNGNMESIEEHNKIAYYWHDKLNRILSYADINGNTIDYGYDAVGNLAYVTYPHGTHVEYKYDANGNLTKVKNGTDTTTYTYDNNNRLTSMTRPNGTVLTREYNNAGQLTLQTDKTSNGTVISSVRFEYDKVGNIVVEERVPPVQPTLPVNMTMSYQRGNLLDEANQTRTSFDADDNMVNFGADSYTYDSRNRLVAHGSTSYSYDSQNHRISQTVDGKTTAYAINPNAPLSQVLEMTEANGTRTVYAYGLGLLSQKKNGKTLYYHYDLRGSTIALTDDNGNIVDRFSYLPYGKVIHDLGNTQTPFLYNGRDGVMTDISGLYYMRARYYDPVLRRFINRDTLLGDIGKIASLNRFAYVNGNPVDSVDSLGLEPTTWERFTRTAGFVLDPIGHYVAAGTKVAAGALISTGEVIGKYTFNKDYDTRSGVGVGLFKEGVSESIEGFNALEDIGAVLTGGSVDDVELGIRNGSLPQKDNKTSRGISVGIDIGYLGKGMLENADDYAKLIKNGISKPKHAVPYILKKPADILMDAYSAGKSVSNYYNDCL